MEMRLDEGEGDVDAWSDGGDNNNNADEGDSEGSSVEEGCCMVQPVVVAVLPTYATGATEGSRSGDDGDDVERDEYSNAASLR